MGRTSARTFSICFWGSGSTFTYHMKITLFVYVGNEGSDQHVHCMVWSEPFLPAYRILGYRKKVQQRRPRLDCMDAGPTDLCCLQMHNSLFIPHHTIVAEYYGITFVVRVSVCAAIHPSVCQSICSPSAFCFPEDNLHKFKLIFTKLGMCIDIVEIWFRIAYGQILLSIFDSFFCLGHVHFFFQMITWVNISGFSPILVCALILWRSGFGLLLGKFHCILTVICLQHTCFFVSDL